MLSARRQELGRPFATKLKMMHSIRRDIVNFRRIHCVDVNPHCRVRSSLGFGKWNLSLLAILGVCAQVAPAKAEEPRTAKEPRLMAESTEITQVADAFDDDDPIDVNLSLGYMYSSRSADILRESAASDGLYTRSTGKIAEYKESTHRLLTRAEIGIFHDVSLVVRMPIILDNSQSLGDYSGSGTQGEALRGNVNEQLFSLPFSSPSRSGIEYLALGLDIGLMNQYRDHTKPTWMAGIETRFSVSPAMRACNDHPALGQVKCAAPGDIDRNGRQSDGQAVNNLGLSNPEGHALEGPVSSRKPGVSRGTTGLELHTYVSKRIKYVEPYGGIRMLVEFTNSSSDYDASDLRGNLVNHPPLRGTILTGIAVIPYEVRTDYQRLTFDFRLEGTYVSEGRDYNELSDALGSSAARSIRMPTYMGYTAPTAAQLTANPTVTSYIDPNSQRVFFTGLLDTQQYIVTRYSAAATFQLNKYIKFSVGTALNHVQSHFLTFDQPCNANLSGNLQEAGPCRGKSDYTNANSPWTPTGIPNPNYRAVINAPGRRFLVDGSSGFDGWLSATAMF